jgi:hypothetical protein
MSQGRAAGEKCRDKVWNGPRHQRSRTSSVNSAAKLLVAVSLFVFSSCHPAIAECFQDKQTARHIRYCRTKSEGGVSVRRKSCVACIKAKTRCDITSPSCSRCSNKGLRCLYRSLPLMHHPTWGCTRCNAFQFPNLCLSSIEEIQLYLTITSPSR